MSMIFYGHKVGDNVLTEVANACSKSLRATDISARLGGEEYVFLCPHTDSRGAFILAERIRKAISELTFNTEDPSLRITASIGISEMTGGGETMINMIKRADSAMYQAKKDGRNTTVVG